MASIAGRRRNCGGDRWIMYWAAVKDVGGEAMYVAVLRDAAGICAMPDGVANYDPRNMTADEAVRAELCEYIDSTELPAGKPIDAQWEARRNLLKWW
jgi:hypothetical protein